MGVTKEELFSIEQNQLAKMAKALGHPARIAILQVLIRQNTCYNGDLVEELGLAQATVSQHLKELKKLGIIQGDVEGTSVCYCINQENWSKFESVFATFFAQPACGSECC